MHSGELSENFREGNLFVRKQGLLVSSAKSSVMSLEVSHEARHCESSPEFCGLFNVASNCFESDDFLSEQKCSKIFVQNAATV